VTLDTWVCLMRFVHFVTVVFVVIIVSVFVVIRNSALFVLLFSRALSTWKDMLPTADAVETGLQCMCLGSA
jgi:hypothetical protein